MIKIHLYENINNTSTKSNNINCSDNKNNINIFHQEILTNNTTSSLKFKSALTSTRFLKIMSKARKGYEWKTKIIEIF